MARADEEKDDLQTSLRDARHVQARANRIYHLPPEQLDRENYEQFFKLRGQAKKNWDIVRTNVETLAETCGRMRQEANGEEDFLQGLFDDCTHARDEANQNLNRLTGMERRPPVPENERAQMKMYEKWVAESKKLAMANETLDTDAATGRVGLTSLRSSTRWIMRKQIGDYYNRGSIWLELDQNDRVVGVSSLSS